jgi:hypothetical protein
MPKKSVDYISVLWGPRFDRSGLSPLNLALLIVEIIKNMLGLRFSQWWPLSFRI